MRLHRLRLVNFRQHRDTELEFGPGLTAIIGANGAGKSTLLEAIAWAMYGMEAARGSRDTLRWRRAKPRAEVRVTLEFGLGAHEYRVERTLFDAALYLDGGAQPIVTSLKDVSARVTRLLGMTRAEFFHTYFTGQKELALMAALRPTERGQFLSRLLGYDKLRLAQERVRARRSEMNGELVALRQGFPDPAALAAERERRATRLGEVEARQSAAEEALSRSHAASDQHLPVFRGLTEFRERYAALSTERRLAEERVRQAVELVERLTRERAEAVASAEQRAAQQEELGRRLEQARAAAGQVRAGLEVLEKSRAEHEVAARAYEERHAALVRERADADAMRRSLRDQFKDIKAQKDRIVTAGPEGACPTCGRPLGGEYAAVLELIDGQLETVTQSGQYYAGRLEQLQGTPEDLALLDERRHALAETVERLAQEVAVARRSADEATALERQRQRLAAEAERLPRLEVELKEGHERRAALVEALAGVEREVAGLEFSEEAWQAAALEMQRLERAWQEAERDVAVARAERGAAQDALREAEQREAEAAARAARLTLLQAELRLHNELDRALGDLRTELNQEMRPELAGIAGDLLATLTDGQYDEIALDEEYHAVVLEDGAPQPVISGGEEDLTNLVLRLGVSQMIADRSGQPLSLLVLDEIFGSLDEARRISVLHLLRGLEARFPQAVLITHVEGVRESVDRVLRVHYDEASGASSVVEERVLPELPGGAGAHVAA
jgi:exonuclease SbcC